MCLRKILAATLMIGSIFFTQDIGTVKIMPIAHAEVKTYTGIGESIISDRETPEIGKQSAKLQAIRNAQEQDGMFIGSISIVNKFSLQKDEIIAFTASVVKINSNVKYEPISLGDSLGTIKYRATVVVSIDTDEMNTKINQWMNKNVKDRSTITAQNNELNKTVDDIKKRNVKLENTIVNAKTPEDTVKIKAEMKELDRDTLYAEKISEGNKLFNAGNRDGAIKLYKEAIELYPNDATIAYEKLGDLYFNLKIYNKAIECYDKVIQMDPKYKVPYHKCSVAYFYYTGDTQKAVEYFNKVGLNTGNDEEYTINYLEKLRKQILANPNNAELYWRRADSYYNSYYYHCYRMRFKYLEEYYKPRILEDLDKIIKLNDSNYKGYFIRATFYVNIGQYNKAIEDFNNHIQKFPQDPIIFRNFFKIRETSFYQHNVYYDLGYCYEEIGNKQKAIENYELALKLEQNNKYAKRKLKEKIKSLKNE